MAGARSGRSTDLQLVALALGVAQLALVLVQLGRERTGSGRTCKAQREGATHAVEALLGGAARAPLRANVAAEVV